MVRPNATSDGVADKVGLEVVNRPQYVSDIYRLGPKKGHGFLQFDFLDYTRYSLTNTLRKVYSTIT
jgi:hypothetical protein